MENLHLIFRKKLPQYNSIEELFSWLTPEFEKSYNVDCLELPFSGAGPKAILGNINYIRSLKFRNELVHITGHENYIAPFCGKRCVLTIHDIGSALSGNRLKRILIRLFWFWIPALFVKKITVISETSAKEVSKLIPFATKKISVVHNPVSPKIKPFPKSFNFENPRILFIGTKPNKNLERTVEALIGVKCNLIIIGKLTDTQKKLLTDSNIDFENESFIPYQQIVDHYKACDLLLFPSLYEGFGLPVLEAQAIGRPVITSNISSLPEVAGDGALFIDPYKIAEITKAIHSLKKMDSSILLQKGFKNVKTYQTTEIAQKYRTVYSQI